MNENLNHTKKDQDVIGIFDSGCGGLTVLRALQEKYPHDSYVYVGDLARLPYGTKSPETVRNYCISLTKLLLNYRLKALVIACNTASTYGTQSVQDLCGSVPVVEVITPAARAAMTQTKNNHIAVIATQGTVSNHAYQREIHRYNPDVMVTEKACQLLVALAEEGWVKDDIARATIRRYLDPVFDVAHAPDTLILGCTHFPLFEDILKEYLGKNIRLINSGAAAAAALDLTPSTAQPSTRFLVTDSVDSFVNKAARFLGQSIDKKNVYLADITDYS